MSTRQDQCLALATAPTQCHGGGACAPSTEFTSRMTARVLERPGNDVRETVVFVHGNMSSSVASMPTTATGDRNYPGNSSVSESWPGFVSHASFFDLNHLGFLGAIPGTEAAPVQPMITQTRAVLDRYAELGCSYREVVFDNCGHSPHLEHQDKFLEEFAAQIRP